tara:strand:+ start:5735 stop:9247 length:3513 start_codon:yes stop_codon:yes gene_type:complete
VVDISKILDEEMTPPSQSTVDMSNMFNEETTPSQYSTINEGKVGTVREDVSGLSRKEALSFAGSMGFADTYRGIKQIVGIGEETMKQDQAKLNRIFANKDYGKAALATYMGGVIADPFGWVIPVAKAKSISSLVKQGMAYGAGFGAAGYTDENSFANNTEMWEQKMYQAGLGAVSGGAITGVIGIAGKKALGFDDESSALTKIDDEVEIQRLQKLSAKEKEEEVLKNKGLAEQMTMSQKYAEKVGRPLWNSMTKNPLGATGALGGAYIGLNYLEDSNSAEEYMINTGITALAFLGGKKLGSKFQDTEMGNKLVYAINPDIHMSPEIYTQWNKMKGTISGHQSALSSLHADLSKLTPEENKLAYQLFSGDMNDKILTKMSDKNKISQEVVDNLLRLKDKKIKIFTKLGEDMRDAGILSDDIFKTNLDSYLRRTYQKVLDTKGPQEAAKLKGVLGKIRGDSVRGRGVIVKSGVKSEEVSKIVDPLRQERILDTKIKTDYEKKFADTDIVDVEKRGKLINRVQSKADPDYIAQKSDLDQGSNYGVIVKDNEDGTHDIIAQLTKKEREELGEIEDAALSVARTAKDLNTTLGLGRFYKGVFDDGAGKYVFDQSTLIGKDKQFATLQEMKDGGYKVIPNEFIKDEVGDNIPKYGALNGKVVSEDMFKDIELLTKIKEDNFAYGSGLANKWFKAQRFWKKTKTVYNPAVHMNNLVANFSMYYMSNGSWKTFSKASKEFKDIFKYERGNIELEDLPKDLRDLYNEGGLSADLVSAEMRSQGNLENVYDDLIKTHKTDGAEKTGDFMNDALDTGMRQLRKGTKIFGPADKLSSDIYQLEDKIFRYALYKTRKEQINPKTGKLYTNEEAAKDAIRYFIDYDIRSPNVNLIRNTAVPFLSYSYRVMPLLIETAVVRPQKFAVLAALGYAANDMGRETAGSTKDLEDNERKFMQDFRKKRMFENPYVDMSYSNIRLPYNGNNGGAKYFDITRKLPGGDVFEMGGQGAEAVPFLPSFLQPGGIAKSAYDAFFAGQDSFTGQKFNEMGLNPAEILLNRTSQFGKDFIPNVPVFAGTPLADLNPASRKVTQAFQEGGYQTYSDPLSGTEALLSTFGLTVNTADVERLAVFKGKEIKGLQSQYKKELKSLDNDRRKGLISFDDYQEKFQDLRERLVNEIEDATKE